MDLDDLAFLLLRVSTLTRELQAGRRQVRIQLREIGTAHLWRKQPLAQDFVANRRHCIDRGTTSHVVAGISSEVSACSDGR